MEDRIYIAIDLKSFYASVECRERGLDMQILSVTLFCVSGISKSIIPNQLFFFHRFDTPLTYA